MRELTDTELNEIARRIQQNERRLAQLYRLMFAQVLRQLRSHP